MNWSSNWPRAESTKLPSTATWPARQKDCLNSKACVSRMPTAWSFWVRAPIGRKPSHGRIAITLSFTVTMPMGACAFPSHASDGSPSKPSLICRAVTTIAMAILPAWCLHPLLSAISPSCWSNSNCRPIAPSSCATQTSDWWCATRTLPSVPKGGWVTPMSHRRCDS